VLFALQVNRCVADFTADAGLLRSFTVKNEVSSSLTQKHKHTPGSSQVDVGCGRESMQGG